ncbi:hypothetical protein QE357_003032 [Siphonobacter sp. BAB-5404]|nr:hypothetical protein [Siphonobacter sp. SORGH_AS_0500]
MNRASLLRMYWIVFSGCGCQLIEYQSTFYNRKNILSNNYEGLNNSFDNIFNRNAFSFSLEISDDPVA